MIKYYVKKTPIMGAIEFTGTNIDEILEFCDGAATYERTYPSDKMEKPYNTIIIFANGRKNSIRIGDFAVKIGDKDFTFMFKSQIELLYEEVKEPLVKKK